MLTLDFLKGVRMSQSYTRYRTSRVTQHVYSIAKSHKIMIFMVIMPGQYGPFDKKPGEELESQKCMLTAFKDSPRVFLGYLKYAYRYTYIFLCIPRQSYNDLIWNSHSRTIHHNFKF